MTLQNSSIPTVSLCCGRVIERNCSDIALLAERRRANVDYSNTAINWDPLYMRHMYSVHGPCSKELTYSAIYVGGYSKSIHWWLCGRKLIAGGGGGGRQRVSRDLVS